MAKERKTDNGPTEKQVEQYEMLLPILENLLNETKELSKKKPDNLLNEVKVKMIDKVLTQVKEILANDPAIQFLDLLNNEKLPSNSDAVFIMAQYEAAMIQFKEKHYHYDNIRNKHRWFTVEDN